MQLRVLCTSASSSLAFDLRCKVREGVIDFKQRKYSASLLQLRILNKREQSGARKSIAAGQTEHPMRDPWREPEPLPAARLASFTIF